MDIAGMSKALLDVIGADRVNDVVEIDLNDDGSLGLGRRYAEQECREKDGHARPSAHSLTLRTCACGRTRRHKTGAHVPSQCRPLGSNFCNSAFIARAAEWPG